MITVLVESPPGPDVAELEGRYPSIEVLLSRDIEETLEKLARNRRIDAVLLLGPDPQATARAIFEEIPAAPALYAPLAQPSVGGVLRLEPGPPHLLLQKIARDLSA
jgi:hypothetical protein